MKAAFRQEIEDWRQAVRLMVKFDKGSVHLDDLLEDTELGRSRWLVLESFRKRLVINRILTPCLRREPRPVVLNLLRLAVTECLDRESAAWPKVVHHAVEVARTLSVSKPELSFINAVLRRLVRESRLVPGSIEATHPAWMVNRWKTRFGAEETHRLLEWNQSVPRLTISAAEKPDYAEATDWRGFYCLPVGRFKDAVPDLEAGNVYVQDPFTRIPVELLEVGPGETVMDLCAAPGGKSRLLADCLKGEGLLIMVDQEGHRLERLRANSVRFSSFKGTVVASRLEELEQVGIPVSPASADAVLLDVPCSNTGVMQKRPDVRLRLSEGSIQQHAVQQLELLRLAARWVRPGGRLVYSTCSLEPEENDEVVERFCRETSGWDLTASTISLPWECRHDGGGAFLLTKHRVSEKSENLVNEGS